jgi:hypothetical protein
MDHETTRKKKRGILRRKLLSALSSSVDEKLTLFLEDVSMNGAPVAKMQLWLPKRMFIWNFNIQTLASPGRLRE